MALDVLDVVVLPVVRLERLVALRALQCFHTLARLFMTPQSFNGLEILPTQFALVVRGVIVVDHSDWWLCGGWSKRLVDGLGECLSGMTIGA